MQTHSLSATAAAHNITDKKVSRRVLGYGVVLYASVSLCACSGNGSDDVVARVGGSPITKATLAHWMAIQAGGNDRAVSNQSVSGMGLKQQVLGFLISSQWTIGEAAELGVKVSDKEAQKQLDRFKYAQFEGLKYEQFPKEAELKQALAHPGETRSDQVWLMKLNMLATRAQQQRFSEIQRQITHTQIANYYNEHKQRFHIPERRDVEVLMTYNEATAKKAKREVLSGKDFLSVIKRWSVHPEAPEGLPRWQHEKPYRKHIFAAKPHVLLGPVNQALDYYIFRVKKITPPGWQPLAQAETKIRKQLATQRQRQISTKLLEVTTNKWTTKTSCRPGYVIPKCREYAGATPRGRIRSSGSD